LPNGNVMIVECGTSRIIEVDRAGKIAKEIKLKTAPEVRLRNQFRGTRKTKDGHYLVCFKGEGKIVELDGDGKVLREVKVPGDPHEVVRLKNNNWLRSEEHTSELQSRGHLVCRLLLEKKKKRGRMQPAT